MGRGSRFTTEFKREAVRLALTSGRPRAEIAEDPPPVPPLVRALMDVREILERARRTGDRREIELAIERISPLVSASRTASRRNSSLRLDAMSVLLDGVTRYQVTGTKPWQVQPVRPMWQASATRAGD